MNEQTNHNYPNKYDETEIDLIDLTHAILRRWRVVLATGVVLGAVLGGYKGATGFKNLQDKEYLAENNAAYESEMLQYTSAKESLEQQIQKYTDDIATNQEYQQSSILMNIDPYDAWRETATFYISTDYRIMPGMDFQNPDNTKNIVGAYLAIAKNGQLYKSVQSELSDEMTIRNLKELVNVTADVNNNLLSVTAYGKDKAMAFNLMSLMKEELMKQKDRVTAGIGEHTITLVEESSINSVDEDLKKKHDDFNANMNTLQSGLADRQTKLAALKKPTATQITKRSVAKTTMKFGIVGLFLGFVLAAGCIFMNYLLGGKLHTTHDIESLGLRVLGDYHAPVKKRAFSLLDELTEKIFGIRTEDSDLNLICRVAMTHICCMVKAEVGNSETISLVSSLDVEDLEGIYDAVKNAAKETESGVEIIGNIITSAEAIAKAGTSEKVVLIEQKETTKKKDFIKEMAILRDMKKEIVGVILI